MILQAPRPASNDARTHKARKRYEQTCYQRARNDAAERDRLRAIFEHTQQQLRPLGCGSIDVDRLVAQGLEDRARRARSAAGPAFDALVAAGHPAGLTPKSTDDDICRAADELAKSTPEVLPDSANINLDAFISGQAVPTSLWPEAWSALCQRHDLPEMPLPSPLRAQDPLWWRRKLRQIVRRCRGHLDLLGGLQHAQRPYASMWAIEERKQQHRRNALSLSRLYAVSDQGESICIGDLAAGEGERRRAELLCRIFGLRKLAEADGLTPYLVTITAPSRMHPNSPKWDGTTPDEAAAFKQQQWERWRAVCRRPTRDRKPLRSYGLRVCEPHKDACPHLHLVVWTDDAPRLRASLEEYFLHAADGTENGAAEKRVKVERARRGHQGAIGYCIKYVCKSVGGWNSSMDTEERKGCDTAAIDTWRATWAVKAFSFFSTHCQLPTVSAWRELRRLKAPPADAALRPAWTAATGSDWAAYVLAWRELGRISMVRDDARLNRYREEVAGPVIGVRAGESGGIVKTRLKTWTIQQSPGPVPLIGKGPRGGAAPPPEPRTDSARQPAPAPGPAG